MSNVLLTVIGTAHKYFWYDIFAAYTVSYVRIR